MSDVGPAPDAASGTLAAFRTVTYTIEAVLFGPAGPAVRTIRHYVVAADRDAQPADTADRATPYRRGARLLVMAQWVEDPARPGAQVLEEVDSDSGTIELAPGQTLLPGPGMAAPQPALLSNPRLVLGAAGLATAGIGAALIGSGSVALALGLAAVVAGLLYLAGRP